MRLRFPLDDVSIEMVPERRQVRQPLFSDGYHCISRDEFSMFVPGVAWYHVEGGSRISITVFEGADRAVVELYLNGSAYGAVLHQRQLLPMHGSCFSYRGQGVMICGEAGAGKSSLTAAFCLKGASFLTDDVSPVTFREGRACILSFSDRMKLTMDSLGQLGLSSRGLERIDAETNKYYYSPGSDRIPMHSLDAVYIVRVEEGGGLPDGGVVIEELTDSDKFAALRNEIYRYEYLEGMPENEVLYFGNLVELSRQVPVWRLGRPAAMEIKQLLETVERHRGWAC